MKLQRHTRSRRGFTLIEVAISVTILATVVGAVALVQRQGQDLADSTSAHNAANLRAARLADRVVREMLTMGAEGANPNPTSSLGTDSIVWQGATGVTAGSITWGASSRFVLQLAAGETDNGVDDDDDGLIDERALVLTTAIGTADERAVTLSDEVCELFPGETINVSDDNGNGVVDERGFNLRRVGDVMQVRVAVQHRGADGAPVTAAIETSFRLRN